MRPRISIRGFVHLSVGPSVVRPWSRVFFTLRNSIGNGHESLKKWHRITGKLTLTNQSDKSDKSVWQIYLSPWLQTHLCSNKLVSLRALAPFTVNAKTGIWWHFLDDWIYLSIYLMAWWHFLDNWIYLSIYLGRYQSNPQYIKLSKPSYQ